ncbi:MAG: LPS-assembly protein LptD [Spirochaetales bacterium]|nr:LPS-assembly protein LptD [Spirochaetales bacterium]
MRKAIAAVLIILLVVVSSVFADDSLLRRSIMACTYSELVQMARSYGIAVTQDETELRNTILKFFGLEVQPDSPKEPEPTPEAQAVTSISIDHAERMNTVGDVIIMSGTVKVSFSAENTGKRILSADTVAIDLQSKILQASGDVVLEDEDGKNRTFRGQVVSLDWSSLDVVVFDGQSSTTRSNSSGSDIIFYVSGKEVSYDGDSAGVFFNDGTIATWKDDPYWSISAKELSLSGNDMFIDRAVFRLGRVPVFYFPVFFYPGTTLSFNPAIGMSSTKGAFLNTTYEVYGQYPRLGQVGSKGSSSSSSSDGESAILGISSFFESSEGGTMIRDGIYYRPLKEGEELGSLEKWARDSGSYLAVFADVYQNLGLSLGFDTLNKLFDKKLNVGALGVVAYRPQTDIQNMRRFRYSFDFSLDYKLDNLNVKASMPLRSDPAVRVDFLNRNTAFALDSLFGTDQYFPSTYSSQSTYTWALDSSYKITLGNYTFNLSSLKADIDYKLDLQKDQSGEYYYNPKVVEASLPYLSFSSDGVIMNLKGESKSSTRETGYSNDLAKSFSQELSSLSEDLQAVPDLEEDDNGDGVMPYKGPDLKLESTSVSEAGALKLGYTYNQTLDNVYKEELLQDNMYTKINGSVYADAAVPGNWFTVKETLKPQFNYSHTGISGDNPVEINEYYLSSVLNASVPKLGISYNLNQRIYVHYSKSNSETITDRWGEWDSTDVTAHNVSFSKTVSPFTFGFYVQLKPLTEILKPNVSYSRNGLDVSADFSMRRPSDTEDFEKGAANLNVSYKNGFMTASVANNYDFTKVPSDGSDPWSGYKLVQKATLNPIKGLSFSENATFTGKFVASSLSVSGSYEFDSSLVDFKASSSMRFTGENYDKDSLNVTLKLSQDEIRFWKKRIALQSGLDFSFTYDFQNPYRTYFTAGLSLSFKIAEFMDLSVSVNSANKSFSRYYDTDGKFSFSKMMEDLARSFDFFGNGRKNTGFNLSSFKVQFVHYMRDWNLYIDAKGSLTTQYTGIYEWVPSVTVYVKWNAIPELRTQGSWDAKTKEWT